LAVYGDNAYGTGAFHTCLEAAGIESKCKTQRPTATGELWVLRCRCGSVGGNTSSGGLF